MTSLDARAPLAVDRRARLLTALAEHGTVRVSELTEILGVAPVTVRRDIAQLTREGLVSRVHGGATLAGAPARPAATTGGLAVTMPDPDDRAATSGPGTRPVGMLVPSLDYYWPEVVRGAEEEGQAHGLRLVLRGSSYEAQDDRAQLVRMVDSASVQALLLAPNMGAEHIQETIAWLAGTGLPVVLVERSATLAPHHEVLESVVSDHALGAALAVRHLAALGHTRVGLVTSRRSPTSPLVQRGWREAARECGLAVGGAVQASVPAPSDPGGEQLLDQVLDQVLDTGTTALLVHADAEAIALVQRLERRGLSVPHDLSVVAYDDEVAGLFSPALTGVRPPRRSIGRAALGLVAARLADPRRPVHRVVISPTLQVRESSAPPTPR